MTESELDSFEHTSECCDNTLKFLKGKGKAGNYQNSLFDNSSNNSDKSDKMTLLDFETSDKTQKENICIDFKKKILGHNLTKE